MNLTMRIATEQKAEADYTNAHLIYTRLVAVNQEHPNLVAQQDLDTAEAKDLTTAAAIAAAKADVEKYQTLVATRKSPRRSMAWSPAVTPIRARSSRPAPRPTPKPCRLVRVSDNYRLRLDFPVSVDYVKHQLGDPVEVRVESLDGKTFTGTISRFTHDVDDRHADDDHGNRGAQSEPRIGAGHVCHRGLEGGKASPSAGHSHRSGCRRQKHHRLCRQPKIMKLRNATVTLGLETPDKYEVVSGLNEGDLVVIGNRASFNPARKSNPNSSRSLRAMKIEIKPFIDQCAFHAAIVFMRLERKIPCRRNRRRFLWLPDGHRKTNLGTAETARIF